MPGYYIRLQEAEVKSRAKYFPSFPTFYSEGSGGTPGARAGQLKPNSKPQISAVFILREFGSLRSGRRAPSWTYPQVIHSVVVSKGVWGV